MQIQHDHKRQLIRPSKNHFSQKIDARHCILHRDFLLDRLSWPYDVCIILISSGYFESLNTLLLFEVILTHLFPVHPFSAPWKQIFLLKHTSEIFLENFLSGYKNDVMKITMNIKMLSFLNVSIKIWERMIIDHHPVHPFSAPWKQIFLLKHISEIFLENFLSGYKNDVMKITMNIKMLSFLNVSIKIWERMIIDHHPAGNYMFKVNNRNTRARCEICSKLTIRTYFTHFSFVLILVDHFWL